MSEPNFHDQRFAGVLARLEAVIDAENGALGTDLAFDMKQSNVTKSRCLYEMTMLFREITPDYLKPEQKDHLKTVKAKLDTNNTRVKAHMEAVREVADTIKRTVAASETDGTYSADQFRSYEFL